MEFVIWIHSESDVIGIDPLKVWEKEMAMYTELLTVQAISNENEIKYLIRRANSYSRRRGADFDSSMYEKELKRFFK